MFTLSDRSASALFMVVVVGIACATATVADGAILAVSPLLVTMLMMFVVTRDGYRGAGWRGLGLIGAGFRWWPAAVLATAGTSLVAAMAVVVSGLGHLVTPSRDGLVDLGVLLVTGTVLAAAEEIGWRGYLQPRLTSWMDPWCSYAVIGVCWATWHLPYILFTNGYHAVGNRGLVLILFVVGVIMFSVLFGMLRDLSGSVWPAVMAHMAHNVAFGWLGASVISTTYPVAVNEYLAGDTGILVLLGTTVAVLTIGAVTGHLPAIRRRSRSLT